MGDDVRDQPARRRRIGITWGRDMERAVPGSRYGVVLALLLVTFVFLATGPTGSWVPLVSVVLQGATLLAALAAAESSPALVKVSTVVIVLGVAGGVAALFTDGTATRGSVWILSFLLVGVAPVAIFDAMLRRRSVDVQTVLGAVCIFILIGMFFAFLYVAIGEIATTPFFAQVATASVADYIYFSFVTLTTVGYGDLSAAGGLGRAMAVLEALFGQVYLVTVMALLVSQLAKRRGA